MLKSPASNTNCAKPDRSADLLCAGKPLGSAFVQAHRQEFPIHLMCRVLEVSKAGFYEHLQRPVLTAHDKQNQELSGHIRRLFEESKQILSI